SGPQGTERIVLVVRTECESGFPVVATVMLIEAGDPHNFGTTISDPVQQGDGFGIRQVPGVVTRVPDLDGIDSGFNLAGQDIAGENRVSHDSESSMALRLVDELPGLRRLDPLHESKGEKVKPWKSFEAKLQTRENPQAIV